MRYKKWLQAAFPLVVMLVALTAVLLVRKGIPLQARPSMLEYLAASSTSIEERADAQVAVVVNPSENTQTDCFQVTIDTLNAMRIPWQKKEMNPESLSDLTGIRTLLVCSQDLTPLQAFAPDLVRWVEGGGRLALMSSPQDNAAFNVLSHKLGITEFADVYTQYRSLRYMTGLLPMWDDQDIFTCDGDLNDFAMAITLESDCVVHMQTAEDHVIPLLWTRDLGAGRIAVNNNTLIQDKDARGYALVTLLALEDEVIYPIINAGMIFIDDFPAPQPEGTDQALLDTYGFNIQGFLRNHWWPDVKSLAIKNGLRYTGVLIETYNDQVTGPFKHEGSDDSLIRYYASELLQSGGEIGLHGYNHIPLCPDGFVFGGEEYVTWHSEQQMADSIRELYRYGSEFLIDTKFRTYVPPSNYLSETGKKVLLDALGGQLRTISGIYPKDTSVNALFQEFQEEEDGTISVPRIATGFAPSEFFRYISAQELMLHGVVSHFVHPDDVLDSKRSGNMSWDQMFSAFSEFVRSIETAYSALRWSTASEGAAAVQRYDRLKVKRISESDGLTVELTPFYSEAWLALKTERPVASVEHGECFKISEGFYWIRADEARIRIRWGVGP